jgi:hypothetical protein
MMFESQREVPVQGLNWDSGALQPWVCLPGAGHEGSPHEQRPAVAVCIGTTDHPRSRASSAARVLGVGA